MQVTPQTQPSRHRILRAEHKAMATIFEIWFFDQHPNDARAASDEAFRQIDQIEQKLSYFIRGSEVTQINALSAGQRLKLSGVAFDCIKLAMEMHRRTDGAFDPTVGALLRGRRPWETDAAPTTAPEPLAAPRIGMNLYRLDEKNCTIEPTVDNLRVDLGGIAKGFAADEAAEVLRDHGISAAMVVAGQSTMVPLGLPEGEEGWPMWIRDPRDEKAVLQRVLLSEGSISASSIAANKHILDPRTRQPVEKCLGAWAAAPTGGESDALSTAFMVMESARVEAYCRKYPKTSAFLYSPEGKLTSVGQWRPIEG